MTATTLTVDISSQRILWTLAGELGNDIRRDFQAAVEQAALLRLPVEFDLGRVGRVSNAAYSLLLLALEQLFDSGFRIVNCPPDVAAELGLAGFSNPRNGQLAGNVEYRERIHLRRAIMRRLSVKPLEYALIGVLQDVSASGLSFLVDDKIFAGAELQLLIGNTGRRWPVVVRHATRDAGRWRIGCEFAEAGEGRFLLDMVGREVLA